MPQCKETFACSAIEIKDQYIKQIATYTSAVSMVTMTKIPKCDWLG